jgi:hypothetical protein
MGKKKRFHIRLTETPPEEFDNDDLRDWVSWAAWGLCDSAKRRIAREIKSHYADALDGAMAEGISREDAHRAAMKALGDTGTAQEAFQQVYLTAVEAAKLENHSSFRWKLRHRALIAALGVFMVVSTCWRYAFPTALLMGALCAVIVLVWAILVPRLWRSGQPRRAALWDVFSMVTLFAGAFVAEDYSFGLAAMLLGILMVIESQSYSLRLLVKLLRPSTVIDLDLSREEGRHA